MSDARLPFRVQKNASASRARAGEMRTLHGAILTPVFMPVGTQATVRNLSVETLASAGSQVLLANTYHLFLRPGKEVFDRLGPIHKFMKWPHSVLTDSGGFQVFSLPKTRKITEDGVTFESYVDGARHLLSPETSIAMQRSIGSDIMMAMDVCIPSTSDAEASARAMEQTHRWALRSLAAREGSSQALFGIVQGACHEKLRLASARFTNALPFDGLAIGGLAVGETKLERERFTELVTAELDPARPRYLMGVGTPIDLLEAVHRGVDMFDCIIPTKLAEQGVVYTSEGRVQLIRGFYKFSDEPLDANCSCPTCTTHSRAYLHHLVKTCEPLSTQLLGAHNVYFFHALMRSMREAILADRFIEFYNHARERLDVRDTFCDQAAVPKVGRRPALRPERMGAFEIVRSSKNLFSIKHSASGEVMHPGADPMSEARSLYVEQSGVRQQLQNLREGNELVVWDVGLGAAFNAMAIVQALDGVQTVARLKLVSFENDLDALRLALCHAPNFPHLRHGGPHALIEGKSHSGDNFDWSLIEGDFAQTYTRAPVPYIIFFDPFSSKTDSGLWTLVMFQKLREYIGESECALYNYTASTAMRARLLLAGFFVAEGQATPPKKQTTVALTKPVNGYNLLGADWLEKLARSDARDHISESLSWREITAAIHRHPQFKQL